MKRSLSNRTIFSYTVTLILGIILLILSNITSYAAGGDGWLGIGIKEMTPSVQKGKGMGELTGIIITNVESGSPADKADLEDDDVILEYNGKTVKYIDEFIKMVRNTEPDTRVTLLINRDGDKLSKEVTIGTKGELSWKMKFPENKMMFIHPDSPWIGIHILDLNKDLADYFKVDENAGILVTEVIDDSPAAQAGLKAGDVVTMIDDNKVPDTKAIFDVLEDYDDGDKVIVKVVRKGKTKDIKVTLEKRDNPNMKIIKKRIIKESGDGECEDVEIDIDLNLDHILNNVDETLERVFEHMGI